jgi:uncharacterized protein YkwD
MKHLKKLTLTLLLVSATFLSGLATPLAADATVRTHANGALTTSRRAVRPNYAWQMFAATNASRRRYGLPSLVRDASASRVALAHCRAMANASSLYHSRRISAYLSGAGRVSAWGENIGWTTGGVRDLQRAFMASPDHRPHVLSSTFRHVAVGALHRGNRLWVTLFFYN